MVLLIFSITKFCMCGQHYLFPASISSFSLSLLKMQFQVRVSSNWVQGNWTCSSLIENNKMRLGTSRLCIVCIKCKKKKSLKLHLLIILQFAPLIRLAKLTEILQSNTIWLFWRLSTLIITTRQQSINYFLIVNQ